MLGVLAFAGVAATASPRTYVGPESVAELASAPEPREHVRVLDSLHGRPPGERASLGRGRVTFEPGVQLRSHIGGVSAFTIDIDGSRYDEGGFANGRVRINPRLTIGAHTTIEGMLDLARGRWSPAELRGEATREIVELGIAPARTELEPVMPRTLFVTVTTSAASVRVGQQGFTWGLGIYANDGHNIDRFGDLRFGDDGPGDLYERLAIEVPLGRVRLGLGGDVVFRDEQADLREGEVATQAFVYLLSPRRSSNTSGELGAYAVVRHQGRDDMRLDLGVLSVQGTGQASIGPRLSLYGAFEGVLVLGDTTAYSPDAAPQTIVQGGATARGYVGDDARWLVGLDAGYASGDTNPDDERLTRFEFDAGHPVGLVLFSQVLAWRLAAAARIAQDGRFGPFVPLDNALVPTRGRVTNTLYLHPKARYAVFERFEVWGGPLIAFAAAPALNVALTRQAGGELISDLGGDATRRYYGTELDLGVRGQFDLRGFWLQAGLQGGVLFPGAALADQQGGRDRAVGALHFRIELRY